MGVELLTAAKKHACSQGRLPCLGTIETVNVTRGCAGGCVFCYARCHHGAPQPGKLLVYDGLPAQLRHELDTARRKRPLPPFVLLGTAGDAFLGGQAVLRVSRACLEILLRRGIGVYLSTRAVIPDGTIELLARYPELVRVAIPIASLSVDYTHRWEPGTALPEQRLFLLQKLQRAGLHAVVRIEPIIPFVNDDNADLVKLFSALEALDIATAAASFLQLRTGVAAQLEHEAPRQQTRLVLACFPSLQETGTPADFDHIAPRQALAALRRYQRLAQQHHIELRVCHCQNPGLGSSRCTIAPPGPLHPSHAQAELFGDEAPSAR